MAELHFFTGTMDSGKSTLALQTNHNHAARGRVGRIFTTRDRAGAAMLSSRLGLTHEALEVDDTFDFWTYVVRTLTQGARIDYLICDEAQFYTRDQIDQLAKLVDELQIDVFAFGILTDFRTALFEGSARLVELADRMNVLQVEALCWCGKRATHNARTENGVMVVEGDQIVVGDVEQPDEKPARGRLRGALPPAPPAPAHRRPRQGGQPRPRAAAVRLSARAGSPTSADQHRDEHLLGGQRPVQADQRRLVGEVGRRHDRGVAAAGDDDVAQPRAAPAGCTGPNQPRATATSRVITSARSPSTSRPGRRHVGDGPAVAVEVAEARLAAEQRDPVPQLVALVDVDPALRRRVDHPVVGHHEQPAWSAAASRAAARPRSR